MKYVFYVNHLTPSIANTKYKIFMYTHGAYLANNPIYLTLYQVPLQTGKVNLFVNINLFFFQRFFFYVSLFLLVALVKFCFSSNFVSLL